MPVDVKIGTVETNLTATSPDLLRSPQFMAEIVRMVKEELKREQDVAAQRTADRGIGSQPAGRRF
jgi:hypothetical protein